MQVSQHHASSDSTSSHQPSDSDAQSDAALGVRQRDDAVTLERRPRDMREKQAVGARFLRALRQPGTHATTFGGKLGASGMRLDATLSDYYPALKIAAALSDVPACRAAVQAFVRQLDLPDDRLRSVAEAAAGLIPDPDIDK